MMSEDDEDSQVYEEYVPTLAPIEIDMPGKKADLPLHIVK